MTGDQQVQRYVEASCADWDAERSGGDEARSTPAAKQLGHRQRQLLQSIIETQVIPRLLITGAAVSIHGGRQPPVARSELAARIGEFAELVVNKNANAALAYFQSLRAQGATVEELFQDLLAPTALRLGELWEEDINDFLDVTRGLATLQELVHHFSEEFVAAGRQPIANKRALLLPVPGEQHSFGISIVSQYFWRAGWRVWGGPPDTQDEIVEHVGGQWFDLVGLSASAVSDARSLARAVADIRKASHNPDVTILIGGQVFNQFPDLAREVGADATAKDGRQALLVMKKKSGARLSAG